MALHQFTVPELKGILGGHGLKRGGTKGELITRLQEWRKNETYVDSDDEDENEEKASASAVTVDTEIVNAHCARCAV